MKQLSLYNVLTTLVIIVFGLLLLLGSDTEKVYFGFQVGTAFGTIGTFLTIAAIINFYFDTVSKRAFFDEISDKMSGSMSFRDAALQELFMSSKEIRYTEEIRKSKSILALFTYSADFLKTYADELEDAIKRGVNIDLYFLDQNSSLIGYMKEHGWQESSFAANYEVIEAFSLKHSANENVSVHFFDAVPRYAALFFDTSVYIVEHTVSSGRTTVPALKLASHGNLAQFYIEDVKRLEKASVT